MGMMHGVFYAVFVFNILTAFTVIFIEKRNVAVTWAWLMVMLFLPIIGFIIYLIFGQSVRRLKIYKVKQDRKAFIDALVERQRHDLIHNRIDYHDPAMANYRDLLYMNLVSNYAIFTQDNAIEIFTDGESKFHSLLEAIKAAKDHIHLQYFIVRNDNLGRALVAALTQKAQEGVTVRFLYDDFGSFWLPKRFFNGLRKAGGEVAAFFPSRLPYLSIRINYRNHRKLAIIDGRYGYIGGFNIGDEYLGRKKRFGRWRDTHLKMTGSSIIELQAHFVLDWNAASRKQIPVEARYFPLENHRGEVGIQIISSGPNSAWEQIKNAYIKMIHAAKESVCIQTPYFVPDESLMTALKTAALSGVDVKLMLPFKPDHKLVYWASTFYLGELLHVGVKCYLYEAGFLHAKTIVVDGKIASVGTANIDMRSFKLNFEVNALIYDTFTATKLYNIFVEDLLCSRELTLAEYERRSRLTQVKEACARLLSPIL